MTRTLDAAPARRLNNVTAAIVALTLASGCIFFGWRALLTIVVVVAFAAAVRRSMSQERLPRPRRWPVTLPLDALLLCGLLPAELAGGVDEPGLVGSLWFVLPVAAAMLVLAQRVRQAVPWPAFDPVVVALLILHVLLGRAMDPRAALERGAIVRGDGLNAATASPAPQPWFQRPADADDAPALRVPWAARRIDTYLSGRIDAGDPKLGNNLDSLIRDELPPIEDLLLFGHPMPIGESSGVLLIGVLLWASYRRLIDWRVPLLATLACYVALAILPTPTSIAIEGRNWRLLPSMHVDVGPATGLTFVHYVLFASPALYTFGLLMTRGDSRPIHGRAIVAWSVALGVATAAALLYVSVIVGPLLAALPAPLLARWADRWLARRPMALADDPGPPATAAACVR